ncbi:MAG: hypothetical protein WCO96_02980 [Actinomycetes bacterium]
MEVTQAGPRIRLTDNRASRARMKRAAEPASGTPETRGQRAAMWLIWIVFASLSMTVLGWVAWQVLVNGLNWSGASGFFLDSMQYLAWVREMSDNFLSANMFSLASPIRNYWNPALALSGLLTTLGVPPDWSYSLWIPVGIVMLIWSVTKYVRSITGGGWTAVTAVALALLFTWPASSIFGDGLSQAAVDALDFSTWDSWPVKWSWGFPLSAVAVSLLCIGLVLYDRERTSERKFAPLLALCALLISWLQPWQGGIFLGLIVLGELIAPRIEGNPIKQSLRARLPLLTTTVVAGAVPLAYYVLLGLFDYNWSQNGLQANFYCRGVQWWTPLVVMGPLLIAALTAVRQRPKRFRDLLVRIWPPLAIAEMYVIAITGVGNTSPHALKGVTIPLAILAAQGLAPWFRKLSPTIGGALGLILVLLLIVPGSWSTTRGEMKTMDASSGHFISENDLRAVEFLASNPVKGGVFSSVTIGSMVPWRTGRQTWLGHETWTPRFKARMVFAEYTMYGALPRTAKPIPTDRFVGWTGARFVLDSCETKAARFFYEQETAKQSKAPIRPFESQLAPITESLHRFGCATVYVLKPGIKPSPESLERLRLN